MSFAFSPGLIYILNEQQSTNIDSRKCFHWTAKPKAHQASANAEMQKFICYSISV